MYNPNSFIQSIQYLYKGGADDYREYGIFDISMIIYALEFIWQLAREKIFVYFALYCNTSIALWLIIYYIIHFCFANTKLLFSSNSQSPECAHTAFCYLYGKPIIIERRTPNAERGAPIKQSDRVLSLTTVFLFS